MPPVDRQAFEAERRERSPWRLWYSLALWRKQLRPAQFRRQPLCERCLARDRTVLATVVNHKIPHKGDWTLFCDSDNHESVCKPCHDGQIQSEERSSARAVGNDGWPLET